MPSENAITFREWCTRKGTWADRMLDVLHAESAAVARAIPDQADSCDALAQTLKRMLTIHLPHSIGTPLTSVWDTLTDDAKTACLWSLTTATAANTLPLLHLIALPPEEWERHIGYIAEKTNRNKPSVLERRILTKQALGEITEIARAQLTQSPLRLNALEANQPRLESLLIDLGAISPDAWTGAGDKLRKLLYPRLQIPEPLHNWHAKRLDCIADNLLQPENVGEAHHLARIFRLWDNLPAAARHEGMIRSLSLLSAAYHTPIPDLILTSDPKTIGDNDAKYLASDTPRHMMGLILLRDKDKESGGVVDSETSIESTCHEYMHGLEHILVWRLNPESQQQFPEPFRSKHTVIGKNDPLYNAARLFALNTNSHEETHGRYIDSDEDYESYRAQPKEKHAFWFESQATDSILLPVAAIDVMRSPAFLAGYLHSCNATAHSRLSEAFNAAALDQCIEKALRMHAENESLWDQQNLATPFSDQEILQTITEARKNGVPYGPVTPKL